MKQLLQNIKSGNTIVEDVPAPTPQAGMALVKVAASLVSAGTERMVVEFAEKGYLGKVRSRPDLANQTLDKIKREGVMPTLQAVFNRLDLTMPRGYSSAGTIIALAKIGMASRWVNVWRAQAAGMPPMLNTMSCHATCSPPSPKAWISSRPSPPSGQFPCTVSVSGSPSLGKM